MNQYEKSNLHIWDCKHKILLKVKFQEVPHEEITKFIKNKNSDLIMK